MEVLVKLNNVKSRLLVWGEALTSSSSPGCPRDVIVTITGNPGIIDFYHEFGSELHKITAMPVCLVGQAGHDIIPDEKTYSLNDEGYLFDLKGQVEHKLDLINNHIDKQKRLHLIGHSIGAWMIIESMCKDPSLIERVASINLLFPTLQEMAVTKSGFFINKIIRKIHVIAMFLIVLLNMLPESVLKMIAAIYLKARSLPVHFTHRVIKYVNPTILDKVLFLAYDEMDSVTALNTDALDKVKHKINVIYSENDGWVPLKYMEDLKQFQPSLLMTQVAYTHEFVLKSSEEVAEMVSKNIKSKA